MDCRPSAPSITLECSASGWRTTVPGPPGRPDAIPAVKVSAADVPYAESLAECSTTGRLPSSRHTLSGVLRLVSATPAGAPTLWHLFNPFTEQLRSLVQRVVANPDSPSLAAANKALLPRLASACELTCLCLAADSCATPQSISRVLQPAYGSIVKLFQDLPAVLSSPALLRLWRSIPWEILIDILRQPSASAAKPTDFHTDSEATMLLLADEWMRDNALDPDTDADAAQALVSAVACSIRWPALPCIVHAVYLSPATLPAWLQRWEELPQVLHFSLTRLGAPDYSADALYDTYRRRQWFTARRALQTAPPTTKFVRVWQLNDTANSNCLTCAIGAAQDSGTAMLQLCEVYAFGFFFQLKMLMTYSQSLHACGSPKIPRLVDKFPTGFFLTVRPHQTTGHAKPTSFKSMSRKAIAHQLHVRLLCGSDEPITLFESDAVQHTGVVCSYPTSSQWWPFIGRPDACMRNAGGHSLQFTVHLDPHLGSGVAPRAGPAETGGGRTATTRKRASSEPLTDGEECAKKHAPDTAGRLCSDADSQQ